MMNEDDSADDCEQEGDDEIEEENDLSGEEQARAWMGLQQVGGSFFKSGFFQNGFSKVEFFENGFSKMDFSKVRFPKWIFPKWMVLQQVGRRLSGLGSIIAEQFLVFFFK